MQKNIQKLTIVGLIFAIILSQILYSLTVLAEEKPEVPVSSDDSSKEPTPGDLVNKMADTPTIQQTGSNQNQSGPAQSVSLFQTDLFSGIASTSVPISLPAGRAGMQPSIALSYASTNENGIAGVGWSFGLGAIQRDERKGLTDPEYYGSKDNFVANFAGASGKLVRVSDYISDDGGYYAYKLESDPSSMDIYYYPDQYWRFHDKSGNDYYFGQNYNAGDPNKISRQVSPDNSSFIYAWYLEKVVDVNGNYYNAEYQITSDKQIKLIRINYAGNLTVGAELSPTYSVQFAYEQRPDKSINYKLGYKQVIDQRLSNILVQYGSQSISKYQLTYDPSPQTSRSLLKKVNIYSYKNDGTQEELTNPVQFEYGNGSKSWVGDDSQSIPERIFLSSSNYTKDQGLRFADLNGDGLTDIVRAHVQVGSESGTGNAVPSYYVWLRNKNGGWDRNTSWDNSLLNVMSQSGGSPFMGWTGFNNSDYGSRLVDVNADNKADLVIARQNWTPDGVGGWVTQVWLNNGNGWTRDTNWQVPDVFTKWDNSYQASIRDQGLRISDVNGDGYADLISGRSGISWGGSNASNYQIFINKVVGGNRSWVLDNTWTNAFNAVGISFVDWWWGNGKCNEWDEGTQLVDVNGDGLADIIRGLDGRPSGGSPAYRDVYLNTGSGWTNVNVSYSLPAAFIGWDDNYGALDQGMRMGDLNGDGLLDLVKTYNGKGSLITHDVWINSGSNWVKSNDWSNSLANIPVDFTTWGPPTAYYGLELLDINNDTSTDFVQGYNGTIRSWVNQSTNADLLKKITSSLGGISEIDYMPTSAFDNNDASGTPKMPFITQVVKSITNSTSYLTESGSKSYSYKTEYSYEKGKYDIANREFLGFGIVTVTDAQGRYSKTYFRQDDLYKGKIDKVESYSNEDQLYNRITNNWIASGIFANKVYNKLLESSTTDFYDIGGENQGGGTKQTKVAYEYDGYANPTKTISYGDMSVSNDEKVVVSEYHLTTAKILNLVKSTKVYGKLNYNPIADVIKKSEYFYDNSDSLDAIPVKGLLTKQIVLNNVGDNPTTRIEYDTWGNATKTLDAKNIPVEIEYDATLHQYPVKVRQKVNDALTLETVTNYDLARGLALNSTDANGLTSRTEYDSLGRVIKQFKPTDALSIPSAKTEYILQSGIPRTVQYILNTDGTYLESKSYYDGLGRTIASISRGIDKPSGQRQYIVSGRVSYDSLGRADIQYPSYSVDNYSDSIIPSISDSAKQAQTQTIYDFMDRVKYSIFAPGTNEEVNSWNIYRIQTGLDPENTFWETSTLVRKPSEIKWTYKMWNFYNAYQQLVKVQELTSDGAPYSTTQYSYDAADNLVRVTDDKGNQTQIAYDALGRKTFMTDPDMGTWQYFYDINGNLIKQIDSKSQTVEMQYDNLNRLTQKTTKEKVVNYYYDKDNVNQSCRIANNITSTSYGLLCATSDGATTTNFWFDEFGREVKNTKTLDGQIYQIDKQYDTMDRLIKVIQPVDPNTKVRDEIEYLYYDIGAIKSISGKENNVIKSYVDNIEYNEKGQKTKIKYGNGTITTYSYNANNQLLNNLVTVDSSNAKKIQDLAYVFDVIGNIKSISDALNSSNNQNFEYDNLSRLTKATQTGGYGTINYEYDIIGNLTKKNNITYTYGANGDGTGNQPHALISKTEGSTTSVYQYDTNGNMINRNGDLLGYDSENHMTSADYTDNSPKVTIELKKGWNFIALPFDMTNKDISSVLSSLELGKDYNQISRWNADTKEYENYANLEGDDFNQLDYGRGYAIYVLKDSVNLILEDNVKVQNFSSNLKEGWNIIGSGKTENLSKEQFLTEFTNSNGAQIFRYNSENFSWEFCGREFNTIEPGKGYAVYLPQNTSRDINVTSTNTKNTTTFVYDENGGRIKKTSGNTTNTYLGPSFEFETTGNLTKVTKSIFEGDNRIVSSNDGADYWYHTNHLGSTDVMTDKKGIDIKTQVAYYPYGKTFKQTGDTDLTKYFYTGKELDNSTELYYYGARYYDPDLQRFTQADTIIPSPSNPQSFNRYAYAANNPIIYNDPSGHVAWFIPMLWGAFIGGASAAVTGGNIGQAMISGAIGGLIFGAIGANELFTGMDRSIAHFIGGAALGGIETALYGGNLLQNMATSGFSAGMTRWIGGDYTSGKYISELAKRSGIGALIGGITAMAMGGDFAEGAKMGFLSSAVAFTTNCAGEELFGNNNQQNNIEDDKTPEQVFVEGVINDTGEIGHNIKISGQILLMIAGFAWPSGDPMSSLKAATGKTYPIAFKKGPNVGKYSKNSVTIIDKTKQVVGKTGKTYSERTTIPFNKTSMGKYNTVATGNNSVNSMRNIKTAILGAGIINYTLGSGMEKMSNILHNWYYNR